MYVYHILQKAIDEAYSANLAEQRLQELAQLLGVIADQAAYDAARTRLRSVLQGKGLALPALNRIRYVSSGWFQPPPVVLTMIHEIATGRSCHSVPEKSRR